MYSIYIFRHPQLESACRFCICVCELVTSQWLSAELCSVQYSSLSLCVPCLWFSISCFTSAEPTPSGALIYDWGSSYNLPSRVQTSAALPSSLPGFILSPALCRELIIVSFSMHCWTGLQLNPFWYIQLLSLSCDMYFFFFYGAIFKANICFALFWRVSVSMSPVLCFEFGACLYESILMLRYHISLICSYIVWWDGWLLIDFQCSLLGPAWFYLSECTHHLHAKVQLTRSIFSLF